MKNTSIGVCMGGHACVPGIPNLMGTNSPHKDRDISSFSIVGTFGIIKIILSLV